MTVPAAAEERDGMSLEDAMKAIEIVKKALAFRPYIKEGIFGKKWMELSAEQRSEEALNPRIAIFYPDEEKNIPALFLRITGDEVAVVEAYFYPIEAAWAFLEEARQTLSTMRPEGWADEQFEKRAESCAGDMMLMMIDNLYRRSSLMMNSFTMETIAQWRSNHHDEIHHYSASKGEIYPRPKRTDLDDMLKFYDRQLKQLWKYQGQTSNNWRKLRLSEEYETLLKHWNRLYKIACADDPDWRQYAKAGNFCDTPDDLLKHLENVDRSTEETSSTRISEIALEHAARRVELIKRTGVKEGAKTKRKEGLLVSDYSGAQLFAFLREGKELRKNVEESKKFQERMATYPAPEVGVDPAQVKRRKSLEQKLDFIRQKPKKSLERDPPSAIKKKTQKKR